MKYFVFTALFVFLGLSVVWFAFSGGGHTASNVVVAESNDVALDTKGKRPVLVELFTSEGCSSCPPADRLLTSLKNERNDDVITLAFHVDYWNYLGWKDRFSSADFSRRQQAYARQFRLDSSYTPQMVVDGAAEFVGSNRARANEVIGKAASEPTGSIDLSLKGNLLTADVQGLSNHSDATIYLAVAESGLFTKVGAGENSGSMLEHSSVVRQLIPIGKIKNSENSIKVEKEIPRNSEWKSENVKYVVFVQETGSLKVLAVAAIG